MSYTTVSYPNILQNSNISQLYIKELDLIKQFFSSSSVIIKWHFFRFQANWGKLPETYFKKKDL